MRSIVGHMWNIMVDTVSQRTGLETVSIVKDNRNSTRSIAKHAATNLFPTNTLVNKRHHKTIVRRCVRRIGRQALAIRDRHVLPQNELSVVPPLRHDANVDWRQPSLLGADGGGETTSGRSSRPYGERPTLPKFREADRLSQAHETVRHVEELPQFQ